GEQAEPGRHAGEEGAESERLVQDALQGIDPRQVGMGGRVGAHHVVGGHEEVVAEVLDRLRVGAQPAHVAASAAELVLGEDRADLHGAPLSYGLYAASAGGRSHLTTTQPSRRY